MSLRVKAALAFLNAVSMVTTHFHTEVQSAVKCETALSVTSKLNVIGVNFLIIKDLFVVYVQKIK
jgi:hypothetical protein